MAIGLLTQKFMYDLLEDIRNANEQKKESTVQWIQANFHILLINKLNIVMDLLDKRRLTADEMDSMKQATELAQTGYQAYEKGKVEKAEQRELNKAVGEQQQ